MYRSCTFRGPGLGRRIENRERNTVTDHTLKSCRTTLWVNLHFVTGKMG